MRGQLRLPLHKHAQFDGSGEGSRGAIKLSENLDDMLRAYKRLNSREARVGFVDAWLNTSASYFNDAWPIIYELLKIVQENELYKDPRRLGKGVHDKPSFESFQEYFEARLKQPFATWFELERTYHYVQNCAPELIKKTFVEAQDARAAHNQELDAATPDLKEAHRPKKSDAIKNDITVKQRGTSDEYAIAKLRKDRPDIHARLLTGELSPHAGMIEAGFRKKRPSRKLTLVARLLKLWAKATDDERAEFLAEINEKSNS
jgi:hypothetical protein